MKCSTTPDLAKRILTEHPNAFFDAVLQNPDLFLNITAGTKENLHEVLDLMEKKDHAAFMKVLQLKNSQNENILHCMIQQNWIDLAEILINKIQKHDASICNTLMVSRNLANNSIFMLILRKMAMENNNTTLNNK